MDEERTPPTRIRITRLQEAQLIDLVAIDQAAALLHHEAGVDPAAMKARTDVEIASLHRTHDVYVAEADHEVAGMLTWRDVPPRIALLDSLCVAPAYQRFGVGSRLLRAMGERCDEVGIEFVVTRSWRQATWAAAFLAATGFKPVGPATGKLDPVPAIVSEWQARHAKPEDLPTPDQQLYWRAAAGIGVKVIPGVPLPR